MKAYVIKKLLSLPLILLGASLIVFLAIRMLPGDPARLMAGPQATQMMSAVCIRASVWTIRWRCSMAISLAEC